MKQEYADITEKLGRPQWWDECGVPRYCEFEPSRCADIYAREAALCEIACQDCGATFNVAFSRNSLHKHSISDGIKGDSLHYGDPPNFDCCTCGPTMNSDFRRVIQYWKRDQFMHWKRDESKEGLSQHQEKP